MKLGVIIFVFVSSATLLALYSQANVPRASLPLRAQDSSVMPTAVHWFEEVDNDYGGFIDAMPQMQFFLMEREMRDTEELLRDWYSIVQE